jgi:hypothetical protein
MTLKKYNLHDEANRALKYYLFKFEFHRKRSTRSYLGEDECNTIKSAAKTQKTIVLMYGSMCDEQRKALPKYKNVVYLSNGISDDNSDQHYVHVTSEGESNYVDLPENIYHAAFLNLFDQSHKMRDSYINEPETYSGCKIIYNEEKLKVGVQSTQDLDIAENSSLYSVFSTARELLKYGSIFKWKQLQHSWTLECEFDSTWLQIIEFGICVFWRTKWDQGIPSDMLEHTILLPKGD